MTSRALIIISLLLAGMAPAAAQAPRPATPSDAAARVRAVADEYVRAAVQRDPRLAADVGDTIPPDRWADRSPAALRAWEAREDGWSERLAAIDAAGLWGTPEWAVHGMLREEIDAARGARVCRRELWGGIDQIFGWHLGLASTAARQEVGTADKRARALARWRDVPRFVDVEIANARAGLAAGYAAPRETVLRVIQQVRGTIPDSVEASPFWNPATRDSAAGFGTAWLGVVTADVYPAMRRYLAFLENEYLPRARAGSGLRELPDGVDCYRATVRSLTSVDVAPDVLRQQARMERERMQAELLPIARALTGVADLPEARRVLKTDARFAFGSRDAKMQATREALDRLRRELPRAFSRTPETPLVLQAAPAFREASSPPAWYEPAPMDGSLPGMYFLNLGGAEASPRLDLAPSATHEGWPGHHLQIAWARERPVPHPVVRLLSTGAFVEGWGMYAERIAYETGMFEGDDLMRAGLLAHLTDALVGLEIDPAIHAFGMTREAAIDSMMAISGRSRAQAEVYADRHAATPGQIVTYMVGYLEIVRLREEARAALGDRFDLRAFHDVVLNDGAMPLPMLRAKVERWVADRRNG